MHNLHFIVVEAEDFEEASEEAMSQMDEWGNDNNWRSVVGVLKKVGDKYITSKENDTKNKEYNTATIKQILLNEVNIKKSLSEKEVFDINNDVDTTKAYLAASIFETIFFKTISKLDSNFDIWKGVFRDYQFDYVGLTNTVSSDTSDEFMFIVVIDMHS